MGLIAMPGLARVIRKSYDAARRHLNSQTTISQDEIVLVVELVGQTTWTIAQKVDILYQIHQKYSPYFFSIFFIEECVGRISNCASLLYALCRRNTLPMGAPACLNLYWDRTDPDHTKFAWLMDHDYIYSTPQPLGTMISSGEIEMCVWFLERLGKTITYMPKIKYLSMHPISDATWHRFLELVNDPDADLQDAMSLIPTAAKQPFVPQKYPYSILNEDAEHRRAQDMFALMVLSSDGYLNLPREWQANVYRDSRELWEAYRQMKRVRTFMFIAMRLPLELQEYLVSMLYKPQRALMIDDYVLAWVRTFFGDIGPLKANKYLNFDIAMIYRWSASLDISFGRTRPSF
jgi:hypothetical protein